MIDMEKVIEALHCRAYDDDFPCSICAYYRPDEKPVAKCDYRGLMDDAIALLKDQQQQIWELQEIEEYLTDKLKEQEAVEPVLDSFLHKRCPSCRALLNGKFCHECGQAVKSE